MQKYKSQGQLLDDWGELLKLKRESWRIKDKDKDKAMELEYEITKRIRASLLKNVSFPILDIFRKYKLNVDEQSLFITILTNTITGDHLSTVRQFLLMLYPKPSDVIDKINYLFPSGKLIKNKLLVLNEERFPFSRDNSTILDACVGIHPDVLQQILHSPKPRHKQNKVPSIFEVRKPKIDMSHVVLKEHQKAELLEIIKYLNNYKLICKTTNLAQTFEKGRGFILLFSGPPGTGKTLSAEAIANELNRKLYTINFAQLESKWVGDTLKRILKKFLRQ
ncbi:MAG: ATP-binding protein [bacterium]|nr:ATP-binding protein [bacterium]